MKKLFSSCDLSLKNIKEKASSIQNHPKYFLVGLAEKDIYIHIRRLPQDAVYIAISVAQTLQKSPFRELNQAMKVLLKTRMEVIYKTIHKDPNEVTMQLIEESLEKLYNAKILKYHSIQFVEDVEKFIAERYKK